MNYDDLFKSSLFGDLFSNNNNRRRSMFNSPFVCECIACQAERENRRIERAAKRAYTDGHESGYQKGHAAGRDVGYSAGYSERDKFEKQRRQMEANAAAHKERAAAAMPSLVAATWQNAPEAISMAEARERANMAALLITDENDY